jgi:hypothetical protein
MIFVASRKARVTRISSWLGAGSPAGWLRATTKHAALAKMFAAYLVLIGFVAFAMTGFKKSLWFAAAALAAPGKQSRNSARTRRRG